MSVKPVYENSAKQIIKNALKWEFNDFSALITSPSELDSALTSHPWLGTHRLVCKPDHLVKRRGKLGLIICDATFDEVKKWISDRINKPLKVSFRTIYSLLYLVYRLIFHFLFYRLGRKRAFLTDFLLSSLFPILL